MELASDVIGLTLLFLGIAVTLLAFALMTSAGRKRAHVRGGGVILIGPIPIVFGSDVRTVRNLLYIALAVTVILSLAFVLPRLV